MASTIPSRSPHDIPQVASGRPGPCPTFVAKLYRMLKDPSNARLIAWTMDGNTFVVLRPSEFAKRLLPQWFKHSQFSSFVRQLNMYGFSKVTLPAAVIAALLIAPEAQQWPGGSQGDAIDQPSASRPSMTWAYDSTFDSNQHMLVMSNSNTSTVPSSQPSHSVPPPAVEPPTLEEQPWCFQHLKFKRGAVHLLPEVRRKSRVSRTSSSTTVDSAVSADGPPYLSSMAPVPSPVVGTSNDDSTATLVAPVHGHGVDQPHSGGGLLPPSSADMHDGSTSSPMEHDFGMGPCVGCATTAVTVSRLAELTTRIAILLSYPHSPAQAAEASAIAYHTWHLATSVHPVPPPPPPPTAHEFMPPPISHHLHHPYHNHHHHTQPVPIPMNPFMPPSELGSSRIGVGVGRSPIDRPHCTRPSPYPPPPSVQFQHIRPHPLYSGYRSTPPPLSVPSPPTYSSPQPWTVEWAPSTCRGAPPPPPPPPLSELESPPLNANPPLLSSRTNERVAPPGSAWGSESVPPTSVTPQHGSSLSLSAERLQ